MPKLKKLVCQVLWADTGTPFREYATCYGDGVVETWIVVPEKPQIFTIRLTSTDFIYEGLTAAVFMDGHYQCNRSRVNLLPAKKGVPRDRTKINFLFRQKEKSLGDGMFMGREWRFDDHNIGNLNTSCLSLANLSQCQHFRKASPLVTLTILELLKFSFGDAQQGMLTTPTLLRPPQPQ